uniref:Fibronectin type-III domain-containing protein n=2 Tax=Pyxicephalus adspersus TaxID=30357 RepID=A0AAV3A761_PYXAD|nr:TPA: hypothetical protein GDO54_015939 [Pyxicephalus adspersus]
MQNLSTDCSNLVVLSDNEKEKQSDQGQTELKNPSKKVDYSAIQKIMESIKEHRNKTLSSRMDKQAMAVIDLTDDEGQKSDRDMKLDESYLSSTYTASPTAAPVLQDIKESPLLKCPEIKEMLFKHRESETFYDGKTPSGHKSVNIHNSHSEISPNADPLMLKPPQKPELRLAQVQNPKGIALSWNIPQTDPSCAPAQVYCLYVHQENPNNSKKLWKKIGEIKALPLPMACTLTQFVEYTTYSFVLRAKDAYGRFGPLCDIQSTTLNNSKKT